MKMSLSHSYAVGTERIKCNKCGRFMKAGRLTKKTPLERAAMPFASICVECKAASGAETVKEFFDRINIVGAN